MKWLIFCSNEKLNKFAYLYSKPLGNHTLKIMKKYLEIYLKTWKNHGNIMEFSQSEKVGTLYQFRVTIQSKSKYQLRLVKANQMTGKRPVQHQDQNLSDVYWRNEIYSVAFVLIFAWAACTFEKRATCHLHGCKTEVSFSLDPWVCFKCAWNKVLVWL